MEYDVGLFMFKQFRGEISNRVIEIETVGENTGIQTRHAGDLVVRPTRTKLAEGALPVRGPILWNSLPSYVRETVSLSSFKKKLKDYLFNDT